MRSSAENTSSKATTNSPSSKIGVGIIGLSAKRGWAAIAQLPAFRAYPDGFEVRALAATTLESARESAAKHGVPLYFGDYHELLKRPEVDLVVVSVKVTEHFAPVEAAILAGKHVLCEWPLGKNLDEAERLEALAQQHGVRTFICLQASGSPYARYVKHLIASGYVGRVLSTSLVGSMSSWGADTPPPYFDYMLDRTSGGNMLSILGGHTLEALTWVLGAEFRELSAVVANQHPRPKRADTGEEVNKEADDHAAVVGTLTNGAVASVHLRGGISRRGANQLRWTINGTRGDLEVINTESGNSQIGLFKVFGAHDDEKELKELPVPDEFKPEGVLGRAVEIKPEDMGYALVLFFNDLLTDLRTGSRLVPSFGDAVRRHRLLAAIERAGASGHRETYA
jgi:predicted dehydrogenase